MNTNIITYQFFYNEVIQNVEHLEKMLGRYKTTGANRELRQIKMTFTTIKNKIGVKIDFKNDILWIKLFIEKVKQHLIVAKKILCTITID